MAGAPKGNKNALKHGIYGVRNAVTVIERAGVGATGLASAPLGAEVRNAGLTPACAMRGPSFAIQYLEEAIDEIFNRMMGANGEEFARLANALSLATTALFNGHRTMAFLMGGMSPLEDAMRELEALDFAED